MSTLERNQHYLRTALALAHAANAAYLDDPLTDGPFSELRWDEVVAFNNVITDTEGFVAVDAENTVVAFRGTENQEIRDWITNLGSKYYGTKVGRGRVHHGFATAWRSVRDTVVKLLESNHHQDRALWLTGHSLGGALATIASRDLPAKYKPFGVHTFGSPRVGDPEFVKFFNVNYFRFVNGDDIVPHVPFQGLFVKYGHVGKRQIMMPNGSITSNMQVWDQLLRKVGRVAVMGAAALPAKAIADHSLDKYIGKLANHFANKR